MSEGSASAGGADAQQFLPRDPLREEFADIGRDSDAACWNAESPFLDNPYAMPSFREDEGDGEASESCGGDTASGVRRTSE